MSAKIHTDPSAVEPTRIVVKGRVIQNKTRQDSIEDGAVQPETPVGGLSVFTLSEQHVQAVNPSPTTRATPTIPDSTPALDFSEFRAGVRDAAQRFSEAQQNCLDWAKELKYLLAAFTFLLAFLFIHYTDNCSCTAVEESECPSMRWKCGSKFPAECRKETITASCGRWSADSKGRHINGWRCEPKACTSSASSGGGGKSTGAGSGTGCVHARAAVALFSCEDGAFLGNKYAHDVRIGDCLFDGIGATEVYHRDDAWSSGIVYIEAGDKQTALTDNHLVHAAAGVVPARLLTVGTALLTNDTVTGIRRDTSDVLVSLIYTKSGRFLADGVIVSSYEHWTDPWLSLDTYILYVFQATSILESRFYKAYFRMESACMDPFVLWLWPYV